MHSRSTEKSKNDITLVLRQLQKREKTGKVVFRLFEKLRYSNKRSTKFESLYQEHKYLEEENGKMVAL